MQGQQTPQPIPTDRPDNLWHSAPGQFAAHGTFNEGAITHSPQLWATRNRNLLLAGSAALGLFVGLRRLRAR